MQFFILPSLVSLVSGHARLVDPRSMLRFGFDIPIDFNDNDGTCGGFNNQWVVNAGKCGLCRDAEVKELKGAPGGKLATRAIVQHRPSISALR